MSSHANPESEILRPRSLFVSSDNIPYYSTSSSVNISLKDPIVAAEGCFLKYGIRQLAYNSTVMNVSEDLNNNKLLIRLHFDYSLVINEFNIIDQVVDPIYTGPNDVYVDKPIYVPDGFYTLDSLFQFLSNSSDEYVINSGYYKNLASPIGGGETTNLSNVVPIYFKWIETPYGFYITIDQSGDEIVNFFPAGTWPGYSQDRYYCELMPRLVSISIEPHPASPRLFDLLFTNYKTKHENVSISSPPWAPRYANNPPSGIIFYFSIPTDKTNQNMRPLFDGVISSIVELDNPYYNINAGQFPNPDDTNFNAKYICYDKPYLNPVYFDIISSLPTGNVVPEGGKNILLRVHPLGADNGNLDFVMNFENPIMFSLEGYNGINNLTFNFQSQDNKWDFFHLEFNIEFLIYEVSNQVDQQIEEKFYIPPTDPISEQTNNLVRYGTQRVPFDYQTPNSRNIEFHKKQRLG